MCFHCLVFGLRAPHLSPSHHAWALRITSCCQRDPVQFHCLSAHVTRLGTASHHFFGGRDTTTLCYHVVSYYISQFVGAFYIILRVYIQWREGKARSVFFVQTEVQVNRLFVDSEFFCYPAVIYVCFLKVFRHRSNKVIPMICRLDGSIAPTELKILPLFWIMFP